MVAIVVVIVTWLILKCSFKHKLLCGAKGASKSTVNSTFLARTEEITAKSIMHPPLEHVDTVACGRTTLNLVDPLFCNELLRRHVKISHNDIWNVHGVYERSQTCELREVERTSALRVREVTSHQQKARVAPMRNRCSQIDGFMVLNTSKRPTSWQFAKWERAKLAAPPAVPVADLGDGRAAVNSVSFQQTARK